MGFKACLGNSKCGGSLSGPDVGVGRERGEMWLHPPVDESLEPYATSSRVPIPTVLSRNLTGLEEHRGTLPPTFASVPSQEVL